MTSWADTFAGRTSVAGFGTASDGEVWSVLSGTAAQLSVSSNEGQVIFPSAINIMLLGSNTGTDMEGLVRWSMANASDQIGIHLRLTDSTHYYRCSWAGGAKPLNIGKKAGGSFTLLANGAVPFTFATSTFYWFRFRVKGIDLYARSWQDGQPEPTLWQASATDSSIASGGVGLFANATTISADTFDSFAVQTIPAIPTRFIYGGHRAFARVR